ncbi:MAG TPA: hypothetical protein VGJ70_04345, partial [Solirubrobacteraceae bacterium]
MADRLAHAPDEPVAPFVDDDLEPALGGELAERPHLGGRGLAVLQADAAPQTSDGAVVRAAADLGDVDARHTTRWMEQSLGQRAVVGQEK